MKKRKKIGTYIIASLSTLFVILLFYVIATINSEIRSKHIIELEIERNTTIDGAINKLNEKGLLEPPWLFRIIARYYSSVEKKQIFAGIYRFEPGTSNIDVLKSLFAKGSISISKVTFPEGIDLEDFATILEKAGVCKSDAFLNAASDKEILAKLAIPANSAEGYLMPDTYEFYKNEDAGIIIERLVLEQSRYWTEEFDNRANQIGMSKHEVLTLASIIEAETPVPEERQIVSGVYHNRLKSGMMLQADPTVQYAIGKQKKLKYSDLAFDSPYNTYRYKGLPPGPINSPSISSIEAALNPDIHDYIFFVAVGDGSGRHNFASTAREHAINKADFKRNRRLNK